MHIDHALMPGSEPSFEMSRPRAGSGPGPSSKTSLQTQKQRKQITKEIIQLGHSSTSSKTAGTKPQTEYHLKKQRTGANTANSCWFDATVALLSYIFQDVLDADKDFNPHAENPLKSWEDMRKYERPKNSGTEHREVSDMCYEILIKKDYSTSRMQKLMIAFFGTEYNRQNDASEALFKFFAIFDDFEFWENLTLKIIPFKQRDVNSDTHTLVNIWQLQSVPPEISEIKMFAWLNEEISPKRNANLIFLCFNRSKENTKDAADYKISDVNEPQILYSDSDKTLGFTPISVIVHHGPLFTSGHYETYVRHSKEMWTSYNNNVKGTTTKFIPQSKDCQISIVVLKRLL